MKYIQRFDNEWICISPEHYIKCCDCGLIHRIKVKKKKGRFYMKSVRDNRKTAQKRRFIPAFVKTVSGKQLKA